MLSSASRVFQNYGGMPYSPEQKKALYKAKKAKVSDGRRQKNGLRQASHSCRYGIFAFRGRLGNRCATQSASALKTWHENSVFMGTVDKFQGVDGERGCFSAI